VYVDGVKMLEAEDNSLKQGSEENPEPWTYFGGQWAWTYEGTALAFRQTSITVVEATDSAPTAGASRRGDVPHAGRLRRLQCGGAMKSLIV
jgi:hypothetical protein